MKRKQLSFFTALILILCLSSCKRISLFPKQEKFFTESYLETYDLADMEKPSGILYYKTAYAWVGSFEILNIEESKETASTYAEKLYEYLNGRGHVFYQYPYGDNTLQVTNLNECYDMESDTWNFYYDGGTDEKTESSVTTYTIYTYTEIRHIEILGEKALAADEECDWQIQLSKSHDYLKTGEETHGYLLLTYRYYYLDDENYCMKLYRGGRYYENVLDYDTKGLSPEDGVAIIYDGNFSYDTAESGNYIICSQDTVILDIKVTHAEFTEYVIKEGEDGNKYLFDAANGTEFTSYFSPAVCLNEDMTYTGDVLSLSTGTHVFGFSSGDDSWNVMFYSFNPLQES